MTPKRKQTTTEKNQKDFVKKLMKDFKKKSNEDKFRHDKIKERKEKKVTVIKKVPQKRIISNFEEEKIRKDFLINKIYPLLSQEIIDTDRIIESIDKFKEESDDRNIFFTSLMQLSETRIRDFIEYLIENKDSVLEEVFDKFILSKERTRIEKALSLIEQNIVDAKAHSQFEKYLERLEKKWEEEETKNKERENYRQKIDIETNLIGKDGKKIVIHDVLNTRTTKVYQDETGKFIVPEREKLLIKDVKIPFYLNWACYDLHQTRPWIKNYSKTYARNIFGEELNSTFVNLHEDTTVMFDDVPYFEVNIKFLICQCNNYESKRSQKGNIFSFFDNNGKVHKLMLVHELNDGTLIQQNEKLFKDELNWLKMKNMNYIEKINKLFSVQMEDFGSEHQRFKNTLNKILSSYINDSLNDKSLQNESLDKNSYSISKENIEELEKNILQKNLQKTFGDYVMDISRILSLFNLSDLGNITYYLRIRVKNNILSFKQIPYLTEYDVFSEIYQGISDDDKINEFNIIKNQIYEKNKMLVASLIYKILNPTEKVSSIDNFKDIDIEKILSYINITCSNPSPYVKPSCNEAFYKDPETKILYCFEINELIQQFENNDFINRHTKKEFSKEFIESIMKFDSTLVTDALIEILFGEAETNISKKDEKEIIKNSEYLSHLFETVDNLEKVFHIEFKMEKNNGDEETYQENYKRPDEDQSEENENESDETETESEEENSEEEPETESEETESESDEEPESESDEEPESESDKETEDESESYEEPETETESDKEPEDESKELKFMMNNEYNKNCKYCTKEIKNNNYKTIVYKNNKPFIYEFCSGECAYSWDLNE